jgi:hypothetical protein
VTIPLASSHITPFFRSVNHYFEWAEDDQGGRTEIAGLPKDDVLESLKRKDAAAGEGGQNNIGFRETIIKTIHEY